MLKQKKVLITGGSRGIGRAIAIALSRAGADIFITYCNDVKSARAVADEVKSLGSEAWYERVNLAYKDEIEQLFETLATRFDHLDIFISNAVAATLKPLDKLPLRHWEYILNANLTAFFVCSRMAAKMMEGRNGTILGVSSLGSRIAFPGYAALGAAKAGMEALVKYMAVEWVEKNINVNMICAGPVETQALKAFQGAGADVMNLKKSFVDRTPLKRIAVPDDLTGLVTFLCSEDAGWIRGQTIVIDGGFSLT